MFQNKNIVNRVSVFWKLVRFRYQDDTSMAEHMIAFKGLINQATSLEVPLIDEVLAPLLLGSLLDNWDASCHIGQRRAERKAVIPSKTKVMLAR